MIYKAPIFLFLILSFFRIFFFLPNDNSFPFIEVPAVLHFLFNVAYSTILSYINIWVNGNILKLQMS